MVIHRLVSALAGLSTTILLQYILQSNAIMGIPMLWASFVFTGIACYYGYYFAIDYLLKSQNDSEIINQLNKINKTLERSSMYNG